MNLPCVEQFERMTRAEIPTTPQTPCARCAGIADIRASADAKGTLAILVACDCAIVHMDGVQKWDGWELLVLPSPERMRMSDVERDAVHRELIRRRRMRARGEAPPARDRR